jgi:hypothetical protein
MSIRLTLWLFFMIVFSWFIILPVSLSAKEVTFRGRVIDYDTKEPIEGAVVVASWLEARPTISGESTRLKDVKETLTDRNGEWSITGEEGQPHTEHPYYDFFTGTYRTRPPSFIIFKPGYCSWPEGFYIEACQGKIKSNGEFTATKTFELPKLTNKERMIMIRNIPSLGMASGSKESLPLFKRLVEQEESEIPGR